MPASDAAIVKRLRQLLEEVDLQTTSEKKLRQTLEAELDEDLSGRKALIREEVQAYLERQDAEQREEDNENGEAVEAGNDIDEPANGGTALEVGEGEEEEEQERRPKKAKRKSAFGSRLSPEMQEFLGKTSMPRTQVVKKLWEYIKANELQNPKDKRKIVLDEKLKQLFKPPLTMLNMNKQLSRHVYAGDPADDDEDEGEDDDEEQEEEGETPSKKRRKTSSAKGSALSPEMQEFLGVERMTRPKVVKQLWDYIKKHGLQDPENKNTILLDDQLSKLFDPPVTSFSMNKQLSRHILKGQ